VSKYISTVTSISSAGRSSVSVQYRHPAARRAENVAWRARWLAVGSSSGCDVTELDPGVGERAHAGKRDPLSGALAC